MVYGKAGDLRFGVYCDVTLLARVVMILSPEYCILHIIL